MAWIRCTGNTGGSLKVRTASGQIATFETNMADVLQSVKCEINATGGNGTPDNPIPINGYTEANITRCGVNLFDKDGGNVINAYLSTKIEALAVCRTVFAKCKPSTQYTISKTAGQRFIVAYTKEIPDINVNIYGSVQDATASHISITTGADAKYIVAMVYNGNVDSGTADEMLASVQIAEGTDTTYHPYTGNTYTIAFGQTVYGGVLDVTRGKLTVTWSNAVDLGSLNWSYDVAQQVFVTTDFIGYKNGTPFMCDVYSDNGAVAISQITNYGGTLRSAALYIKNTDFTDAPTFKTAMSGKYITAELATPFDIDLTPVQVEQLLGKNNVWHDANGDTEVKYLEVVRN